MAANYISGKLGETRATSLAEASSMTVHVAPQLQHSALFKLQLTILQTHAKLTAGLSLGEAVALQSVRHSSDAMSNSGTAGFGFGGRYIAHHSGSYEAGQS